MDDIDQWIPNLLRGKRVPADVVYNIRKNPSLLSPGITSRRRAATTEPGPQYLILFVGESNSGGVASNSGIPTTARPEVLIFDNAGLNSFDQLRIGVNNLVGHTGLPANATHGWEQGLYEDIAAGQWPGMSASKPAYLVKAGQGGSTFEQWEPGNASGYLSTLSTRWTDALALLPPEVTGRVVWASIGINNAGGANEWTVATMRPGLVGWLEDVRSIIGADIPIIFARLMPPYQGITFLYEELARTTANTYCLAASDDDPLTGDGNHWDSPAMEVNAGYLGTATRSLPDPRAPALATCSAVSWTDLTGVSASGGQVTATGTGTPCGSRVVGTVDAATAFRVEVDLPSSADSNAVVVYLDTVQDRGADDYVFTSANDYLLGAYQFSDTLFLTVIGGAASTTGVTVTYPFKWSMTKAGDDVMLSYSTDAGATWTTTFRAQNALAGQTTLYVKAMFVVPAVGQNVTVKVG